MTISFIANNKIGFRVISMILPSLDAKHMIDCNIWNHGWVSQFEISRVQMIFNCITHFPERKKTALQIATTVHSVYPKLMLFGPCIRFSFAPVHIHGIYLFSPLQWMTHTMHNFLVMWINKQNANVDLTICYLNKRAHEFWLNWKCLKMHMRQLDFSSSKATIC